MPLSPSNSGELLYRQAMGRKRLWCDVAQQEGNPGNHFLHLTLLPPSVFCLLLSQPKQSQSSLELSYCSRQKAALGPLSRAEQGRRGSGGHTEDAAPHLDTEAQRGPSRDAEKPPAS